MTLSGQAGRVKPIELFRHCPRCGLPRATDPTGSTFRCGSCGFVYYFNPATAAAAFILNPLHEALFIRRAKEPAKGKLAIPGGFIDFGETAEDAVRREIREEVNLQVHGLRYLCTQPNQYHFQEVTYSVLDLFFVAQAEPGAAVSALDDVESYSWLNPVHVRPDDLAFPSIRAALALYLRDSVC
jgi:ADP-ribose pyrophosphatase YjhB (NUDIX family)